MTVASQVKQTIANLKGAQATLETFADIEQDPYAREIFKSNSRRILSVMGDLEKRLGVLEFEEPQYKGF